MSDSLRNFAERTGLNILDCSEELKEIGGISTYSVGVCGVSPCGQEVMGAASGLAVDRERTVARAGFELLERATIADALRDSAASFLLRNVEHEVVGKKAHAEVWLKAEHPEFRYAFSNGVAFSSEWSTATRSALEELKERDSLQRAWFQGAKPHLIADPHGLMPDVRYYRIGRNAVMAVRKNANGVYEFGFSYSDGESSEAAGLPQRRALQELIQRAVFCEELDEDADEMLAVPGPDYHLWHTFKPEWISLFESWLKGRLEPDFEIKASNTKESTPLFIDLSAYCPKKEMFVAKAVSGIYLPLAFGRGRPELEPRGRVALSRWIHPCF